jgi:hypothetical protein
VPEVMFIFGVSIVLELRVSLRQKVMLSFQYWKLLPRV